MALSNQDLQFKRKFPRRKFRRAMGFLFNGDYHLGTGDEIGEGGLSLRLQQDFPVGKEAVLSFQLPGGSFVCVRIEIRNAQKNSRTGQVLIGCLFKNIKFERKREIRSYVSARTETDV